MSGKIRHMFIATVAAIAVALLTFSSIQVLAWFINSREGSREIALTTDEGVMPELAAWRFHVTNEESGMTFEKNGTWESAVVSASTTSPKAIQSVTPYASGSTITEKYQFTSLHLGTVDNLLDLSKDNYFYVRLAVTDVAYQGRKAKAGFSLTEAGIHFYDQDGVDQTSTLSSAIGISGNRLFTEFCNLFIVECATSATAYDPINSYASLEGLFSSSNATYHKLTRNAAAIDLFASDQTAPYYIYFRFSPDLDKCFDATETTTVYMPCEILFDVTLNLEFYEIHH